MTIYSITYFTQKLDFLPTIKNSYLLPSIKASLTVDACKATNYAIVFQLEGLVRFIYSDPKEMEISLLENS